MSNIIIISYRMFIIGFVGAIVVTQISNVQCEPTPIVMYHGMGDTAHGSIQNVIDYLTQTRPGIYIVTIQMGSNSFEDYISTYFLNLNRQVELTCANISADPKLSNGYHGIGFSQGGQIMRAIAQRCPTPTMKSLVTIGGQHQGVFGLPRCFGSASSICDYIRKMMHYGAYLPFVQNAIVQAQYWHDPLNAQQYVDNSIFLADINNERSSKNETYRTNLLRLEYFVMVMFLNETTVEPKETEWFEFYETGSIDRIKPLEDTDLYRNDWIGLRELNDTGRLVRLSTIGDHLIMGLDWFQRNIVDQYLQ